MPMFLLRRQHQKVLRPRKGRVEQPPEVEILDVIEWIEEHVRAGRKYGHTLAFEKASERHHLVVLYRAEQEGDLIPIRKLAGCLQAVEEGQHLGVPVGCVSFPVTGGQSHRRGHIGKVVVTRDNLFGETKDTRAIVPDLLFHPIVVKADDVRVRAVIDGELDLLALAIVEQRRELQNVAYGRAAKAVQTLVVVANHAQILVLTRQQQEDALLNGVCVLVLVHHQMGEPFA